MIDTSTIPFITTAQMIEVDRLMVEEFGIQLIQMMENAGRHLATLAKDQVLKGKLADKSVIVLAGSGGNGGGALAAARNLSNWGARVGVFLTRPVNELSGEVLDQAKILQSLNINFLSRTDLVQEGQPDLIIDGIIGYSLKGSPRGQAADMIKWANFGGSTILSLDVPSGLDASTGEAHFPVIQADLTMTLALPKKGLKMNQSDLVGDLYLADIGVPPIVYEYPTLNLNVGPIFQDQQILHLR